MKLCFPISAFNAHTYFFLISEKRLHENMQKTLRTTLNLFNNRGQIKAKRSENSSFSYVAASKVWCTFGQRSHAKINNM